MIIQDINAALDLVEKINRGQRRKALKFSPICIAEDEGRVRYAVEVTNCGKETIVSNTLGFNKRESPITVTEGIAVGDIKTRNRIELPVRLDPGECVCIIQTNADCSRWIRGSVRDTDGNFHADHLWFRIVTKAHTMGLNHQMEVEEETEEEREAIARLTLATKQGRKTNLKADIKRWKTRLKMGVVRQFSPPRAR